MILVNFKPHQLQVVVHRVDLEKWVDPNLIQLLLKFTCLLSELMNQSKEDPVLDLAYHWSFL